jgi:hypothetical protein
MVVVVRVSSNTGFPEVVVVVSWVTSFVLWYLGVDEQAARAATDRRRNKQRIKI